MCSQLFFGDVHNNPYNLSWCCKTTNMPWNHARMWPWDHSHSQCNHCWLLLLSPKIVGQVVTPFNCSGWLNLPFYFSILKGLHGSLTIIYTQPLEHNCILMLQNKRWRVTVNCVGQAGRSMRFEQPPKIQKHFQVLIEMLFVLLSPLESKYWLDRRR